MALDIKDIKRLKELTGVGLTDAKSALEDAKGDFDKALEAMRKKGMTKAEKRGERETRQGVIGTYNHDNRIGVIDKAKEEGKPEAMIAKIVDGQVQKYFAEKCLLNQPFVKNPDITVGDFVKEHNARLGENIVLRRFSRMALGEL